MKAIKQNLLRDPRYPVHRIADKLLPFIKILVDRFDPVNNSIINDCPLKLKRKSDRILV